MNKFSGRWDFLPAAALALAMAGMTPALLGASPERPDARPAAKAAKAPGTPRPVATGSRVAGASFGGTRVASILGAAWNVDNTPIKEASLRLRNVVTGKIEALTKADETGQFAFENVNGGSYVVELVTASGKIQTVGHVFTIAPGETVATFVRVGTKVPWGTAFFKNTGNAVASSAASEGITAITPIALCSSPPCNN
jgi:hypothetical protein